MLQYSKCRTSEVTTEVTPTKVTTEVTPTKVKNLPAELKNLVKFTKIPTNVTVTKTPTKVKNLLILITQKATMVHSMQFFQIVSCLHKNKRRIKIK